MIASSLRRMSIYAFIASIAIFIMSAIGWRNFQVNLARTFIKPPKLYECLYSFSRQCDFTHKLTGMFGGDFYNPITAFAGIGLLIASIAFLAGSIAVKRAALRKSLLDLAPNANAAS